MTAETDTPIKKPRRKPKSTNNKPPPKKPAAKKPPKKPAAKKPPPKKARTILPWRDRVLKRVTEAMAFLSRTGDEMKRSDVDAGDVASALTYLEGLKETVEALAEDWKPEPKGRTKALKEGDEVTFKQDCAKHYEFLGDLDELMNGAKVASVFDERTVLVEMTNGQQSLFQKRHLDSVP